MSTVPDCSSSLCGIFSWFGNSPNPNSDGISQQPLDGSESGSVTSEADQQDQMSRSPTISSIFSLFSSKSEPQLETIDSEGRIKVGEVGDHVNWTKNIQRIKLRGESIALFWVNETYFALSSVCSHQGGPLDQGDIEDMDGSPCVRCPIHGFKFDLETGMTKNKEISAKSVPTCDS
eukprot:TRINITY_DN7440_c0_g1_i1.p1 TRINITY_DN7440_c0_g1~~TRINITY_DN7440_c0_g1_i1.p1  ORF type:complete len:176 (+),score=37.24 TRINITY_DN7440_c0_g1_i1:203-730(+)